MKTLKTKLRKRFNNENLSSRDILNLLQKPEEFYRVEDIIKEYIEYLSVGVSNMALLFSADTVALGGSFVHYKDLLFPRLKEELDVVMSDLEKRDTKIKIAELGNDAGMIGATLLK